MIRSPEILSAFKQRSFSLDCVEMTLVQKRRDDAVSYEGLGYIQQGEDDRLSFKIYVVNTKNTSAFEDLKRFAGQNDGNAVQRC